MLNGILKNFPSEYHWLVGAESKVWSGSQLAIADTYFSTESNPTNKCADINSAGKLTESVCPSPGAPLTAERLVSYIEDNEER